VQGSLLVLLLVGLIAQIVHLRRQGRIAAAVPAKTCAG